MNYTVMLHQKLSFNVIFIISQRPLFQDHYLPSASLFSSAVPSGSGAFQMPTRPSASSSASSSSSAAASTLRGGRANLRNASVTFSLFGMRLLWDDINNIS